ncbi:MAG: glycoside hydrolase family 2, partial [Clostridia bacterium]|nr:glycoside hydrolase family 2 [Clostridia bacterium]
YTFCEREIQAITNEWQEIISVAKNFTSVVAYVPLNESWGVREIKTDRSQQNFARSLYYLTKSLDDTRLVSTNDGFETIEESDILSIHDYDIKSAEEFSEKYNGNYDGMHPQGWALFADGHRYQGNPVLFTEFRGIAFLNEQKGEAWGYGNGAKDESEFCARLEQLLKGIARTDFQGYCYTQLTDVQQEVNGLLYADRTPKADLKKLKEIFETNYD